MKTIDIKTTQNVIITYELAGVRDRVLAFVIDVMIKLVAMFLLMWLYFSLFSGRNFEYFYFMVVAPIHVFYTLFFEMFMNGQTPGKRMLKIKVVKLDGKQPAFYDYLIRWSFRIVDIALSLGVIAVILAASTEFAQRLGDMASNSTVVRVNSRVAISLKDLMKIETLQNYTPQYPAISNFREEDILLIKQTIERYHRFRNEAHREALLQLSNNLSAKLELEKPEADPVKFLKTLIKDYIVLTR